MAGETIEVKGDAFGKHWIPCTLESIMASGLDKETKKMVQEWYPAADVFAALRLPGITFRRITR